MEVTDDRDRDNDPGVDRPFNPEFILFTASMTGISISRGITTSWTGFSRDIAGREADRCTDKDLTSIGDRFLRSRTMRRDRFMNNT
ncbi:hypothetical protein A2U01_0064944 [Trifolium medium]|uniref:Uncharacterized protein n=1 Tax=Trifolium medium TaxID=97028 RepID=A0A392S742_9FABA|nr:hypothetical protein [Trifolium medium]